MTLNIPPISDALTEQTFHERSADIGLRFTQRASSSDYSNPTHFTDKDVHRLLLSSHDVLMERLREIAAR